MKLFFLLMLYTSFASGTADDICNNWFKSLNIVLASNCESNCSTAMTDLGTFVCKSKCDKLCAKFIPRNQSLTILNPVLNKSEQSLAQKFPLNSLDAYRLSFNAESICSELFLKSLNDDESDACRHFMWSYLMAQKINISFAKKVLAAHENEPLQTKISKEMDELNNSHALNIFQNSPKLNEIDLKNFFLRELNSGNLKVNMPNAKNWRKQNEVNK